MAEHFTADEKPEEFLTAWLEDGLGVMRKFKPGDRSSKDRYWAVAITKMEDAIAWWNYWVMGNNDSTENIDVNLGETVIFGFKPEPDETVVIQVPYYATVEQLEYVASTLQGYWPDNNVLVMDKDMNLIKRKGDES